MAEKKVNRFLIIAAVIAMACLLLVMCSKRGNRYEAVEQLPTYDPTIKRQDGDTQADTIKALQAYAREAVDKADALHESTEEKLKQILENQQHVRRLERNNQDAVEKLEQNQVLMESLQSEISKLKRDLDDVQNRPQSTVPTPIDGVPLNDDGLPIGFGFDDAVVLPNTNQGAWYESIDQDPIKEEGTAKDDSRFNRLLPQSQLREVSNQEATNTTQSIDIDPVYTIPKDSTLTDAIALTALIGRIPVDGQTPDPYPVKIYVGKETLIANGHVLPEIDGMIFSGLGFGDWNLSCVSARLMSATYIFNDGTIVNHTSDAKPLGYISDPSGVPCVSGKFVSNAPAFISQRIGLASLGAAGSAYSEAQQQRQTSALTGTTTSTVIGDIDKLVAGEAVQSATNEVSRWLLARQKQSFDAVVINPGAPVAVHLDQTLALDKISIARKLRYAKNHSATRTLD